MKEDIKLLKEELDEVKVQSAVTELIAEANKTNKRIFIVLIIVLCMWFATIGAFLYYINTTGFEETTEIADTSDGGNACVGDNCNNGEINYGESNKKN